MEDKEQEGDLDDNNDNQNGEGREGKPRIFEVARWVLDCIEAMRVFSLLGTLGLWQLRETGAASIMVTTEPPAGAQPRTLLTAGDLFRIYGPFVGDNLEVEPNGGGKAWVWTSTQQRDAFLDYLKTEDHVMKTIKWITWLIGWKHDTLQALRKVVAGGIVVLPGRSGPIALDLREATQAGVRTEALGEGTPMEQWQKLQRLVLPAPATNEQEEQQKELAFIFEVRHRGVTFEPADFASLDAIKTAMTPFTKLLEMLQIGREDQRFLLKWLALLLRRKFVPAVMIQSLWLARLLLHTFIPPEAVCHLRMHQQLPASSPGAASFPAILCSNIGVTLSADSPLCALIEQRGTLHDVYSRDCAPFAGPPLLLVCARNHAPALAGGAETVVKAVRFIHSPTTEEGDKEVEDLVSEDEADLRTGVVFAAAYGACLLQEDGGRLLFNSSPPLLSHVAPDAGNVRRPKIPFQKDTLEYWLLQVMEGLKHALIIAYNPLGDDLVCVDLSMLCTIVFLLESPFDTSIFVRANKNKDPWTDTFNKVAQVLAERRGCAKVQKTLRMFQPGDRGSHVKNRIEALGSSSAYDAEAVFTENEEAEGDGGNRVCNVTISADDLHSIFPPETLAHYEVCETQRCRAGDTKTHLRNLCALSRRLKRRGALRENKKAFFEKLLRSLERQCELEFPGDMPVAENPAGGNVDDALERRVKELAKFLLSERKARSA